MEYGSSINYGIIHEEKVSKRRSYYECSFCKRGFSNAQALGGHMNLHRKDRAKAKQLLVNSNSTSKSAARNNNEDQYIYPIYSASSQSSSVTSSRNNNYDAYQHMCFQFPQRNNYSYPHDHRSNFLVARSSSSSGLAEEVWGANLSLQIGARTTTTSHEVVMREEIDLELRL